MIQEITVSILVAGAAFYLIRRAVHSRRKKEGCAKCALGPDMRSPAEPHSGL